jgi:HSP20 family protein
MAGRSLLPFFSRNWSLSRPNEDTDPFMAFRREMNRVFDDTFKGFGMPSLLGPAFGRMPMETLMPQIDVSESDHEIQVTAELPGIDEKDVEVILADDMLTIRGEKKAEHEQKDRDYHLMERSHGTFSRSLPLPFAADPSQVKAAFKNGVLTVTIQKPKEVLEKQHRIEVRTDGRSAGEPRVSQADRPAGSTSSQSTPSAAENKVKETAAE